MGRLEHTSLLVVNQGTSAWGGTSFLNAFLMEEDKKSGTTWHYISCQPWPQKLTSLSAISSRLLSLALSHPSLEFPFFTVHTCGLSLHCLPALYSALLILQSTLFSPLQCFPTLVYLGFESVLPIIWWFSVDSLSLKGQKMYPLLLPRCVNPA